MSTYVSLHYHMVFATKHRTNFIHRRWEDRLHQYIGGVVRGLDGFPQSVGGVEDHIHLLVGLRQTHCISTFMRELKKASSQWVHEEIKQSAFAWQEGYAVFSVSADVRPKVNRYIVHQREHHRVKSYREELVELLEKAGIEYDPKYLD